MYNELFHRKDEACGADKANFQFVESRNLGHPMTGVTFGDRLDRWFLKKGFRLKFPLSTLRLIVARRIASSPRLRIQSRRAAQSVIAASKWANFIAVAEGYQLFSPETFPELPEVVTACEAVYARHATEVSEVEKYNKPYFFNILTMDDLRQHRVLLDFALSTPVTEAVTGYLGQIPRLHSMGVFYSSVNDSISGSQMYHVDGDALSQVKCFVNVWEVGSGGGAFTFLPKQQTSSSLRSGGLLKTISDQRVYQLVPEDRQVAVVGSAGGGVFVDTSRCLHQGSRSRQRPRLVFQFQYVTRPDALLRKTSLKVTPGGHLLITRALLNGLNLSNTNAGVFVV